MSLIFKNVQKAFGKVVALEAINFEVEHGEIRGILGGNGSGKSTLTKILGGMVSKDSGEITLDLSLIHIWSDSRKFYKLCFNIRSFYSIFDIIDQYL